MKGSKWGGGCYCIHMHHSGLKSRFRENAFSAWCLVFAFLRLFLFNSAYPFFNARDEELHYDMVVWSSGFHIENSLHRYDPRSARDIVLYGSPEYLHSPAEYPGGRYPLPVFRLPEARQKMEIRKRAGEWTGQLNRISLRPPLYYLLVSAWEKAGVLFGIKGGYLLYWLRYFNIPIYLAFMLIGIYFARRLPGNDPLFRLGIPFMLAVFPQDVFYALCADVPSALLVGISFILLTGCTGNPARGYLHYALLGLSISMSVLSKFTNIPVLAGMLLVNVPSFRSQWKRRGGPGKITVAGLIATLPVAIWLARNALLTGGITATSGEAKLAMIGMKPLREWLFHPVFTPVGAWDFVAQTIIKYWRGGIIWGGKAPEIPAYSYLYAACTLAMIGLSLLPLLRKPAPPEREKMLVFSSLGAIGGGLLFLAVYSAALDDWWKPGPSKILIGVTEGRFLLGTLLPFTYLFLKGLGKASAIFWRGQNRRYAALAVLFLGGMLSVAVQILTVIPLFGSQYNWFHLP